MTATPAAAADGPRVLVRAPYYLALHPAEHPARGTVLLVHGGGWHGGLGSAADELMDPTIEALQDWGYDVANLGYRGGSPGLRDAGNAFARLRGRLGENETICIYGASAGAQLGLMVAAERSDVDCVVDLLGPPDLEEFGAKARSQAGERLAREAFGADRLAELSPVNNADRISAPVLIGAAPCDAYIRLADQRELARRLALSNRESRLEVIATGDDLDLEHCLVEEESFDRFQEATRRFLNDLAPAPPAADPAPADDGSEAPWAVLVGGLVLVVGGVLLVRALRH